MKRIAGDTYLTEVASILRRSRQPEGAVFELTYGCNLRCVHCYNPTHRALPHELTTVEICAIVTQMAECGVLTVSFSGGEPSVRPDIRTILRHTRSRGLLIRLMTNATRMTLAFADMLEEYGVSDVFVSIYGATRRTYECMTDTPGSFAHFLRGLDCLVGRSCRVTARMPVTTINEHELDACQDLTESRGFKFQYCLDIQPRTNHDVTPLQYRLLPHQKAAIDRRKLALAPSASIAETCSSEEPFISCACGRSRFAVTPYGHMNLCVAFPIPQYDLRAGTVREGWEVLKHTADAAKPNEHYHCPTCQVNRSCRQGRADAWLETGDMSVCLPHFREWAELEHRTHALLDPRRPA